MIPVNDPRKRAKQVIAVIYYRSRRGYDLAIDCQVWRPECNGISGRSTAIIVVLSQCSLSIVCDTLVLHWQAMVIRNDKSVSLKASNGIATAIYDRHGHLTAKVAAFMFIAPILLSS